jgi:tRNA threonylcarbamoyladenosine biosynthesis protein TsaE
VTSSATETEAAGERLARHLQAGDLLLLQGPLGGGKTTFVRGVARGLAVAGAVQSPTFQLLRIHPGRPALVHVDLYRLEESSELVDLGIEEHLEDAVVAVEWGDRLAHAGHAARIVFEPLGADRRRLRLLEAPPTWSW